MDNLRGDIEQLRGAIETLMIRVGTAMLPGLRNITQTLTGVIEGIMDFADSISDLMDTGLNPLESMLGAVQIAFLNAGWDTAADAMGVLMLAARDLVEAFDDLVDAGQALIAGDLDRFFDELGEASYELLDALSGVSDALFAGLQAAFDAIPWGTLWDTAVAGLEAVIGGIIDLGEIAVNAVIRLAGDLAGMAGRAWAWILEKLGFGPVMGDGTGGPNQGYEIPLGTVAVTAALKLAGMLAEVGGNLWNWVKGQIGLGGASGPSKTGAKSVVENINLGTILIDGLLELGGRLKGFATNIGAWIRTNIKPASNLLVQAGSFLIDGAIDLGGRLKGLATNIAAWVMSKMGAASNALLVVGSFLADGAVELGGMLKAIALNAAAWVNSQIPAAKGAALLLGSFVAEATVNFVSLTNSVLSDFYAAIRAVDWIGTFKAALGSSFELGTVIGEWAREAINNISFDDLVDAGKWAIVGALIVTAIITGLVLLPVVVGGALIALMGSAVLGFAEGITGIDFSGVAGAVLKRITDAIDNMVGFAEAIKNRLVREFNEAKPSASDLGPMAIAAATALMTAIPNAIAAAVGFAAGIKSRIIQEFRESVPSVGELAEIGASIAQAIWDAVKDAFTFDIGDLFTGGGGETGTPVRQTLKADDRSLGGFLAGFRNTFDRGTTAMPVPDFSPIINAANAARQAVVAAFTNMQIQVAAAVRNTATSAGAAFAGLSAALVNPANMARQAVHAVFVNLQIQLATTATAIVTSVAAAFTPITARLQQITMATVMAVQATFMQLPPIAMQIGAQATQSFISAFTPIQPQATQIANSTRASVTSALQAIVGPAGSSGSAAGNAFVSGFRAINAAAGVASGAVGSIRGILAGASSGAFGYGAAVGNQFAAGIRSSLGAVAAAAAALRALMPSSPAKTGPLSKPISFDYVLDSLESAMGGMAGVARRGMMDTQRELNRNAGLAYAGRMGGMGGGQNVTIITLEPGRWAEFLQKANNGNTAYVQMSPRGREVALGLRGA
jgi:hypothetical protein